MSPVRIRSPLPGPLVKRLRHRPFTAVTWVRFPYGSPKRGHLKVSSFFALFNEDLNHKTQQVGKLLVARVWLTETSIFTISKHTNDFHTGHHKPPVHLHWRFVICLNGSKSINPMRRFFRGRFHSLSHCHRPSPHIFSGNPVVTYYIFHETVG